MADPHTISSKFDCFEPQLFQKYSKDDKKSDFIEREYIDPLSACTAAISDKAAEISNFVALIENRLEETEDI